MSPDAIKRWCQEHSLLIKNVPPCVALTPTCISRDVLQTLLRIQDSAALLVHGLGTVRRDALYTWHTSTKSKMLCMLAELSARPVRKRIAMSVIRADYLLSGEGPKMVEINTIAAAFGRLGATLVPKLVSEMCGFADTCTLEDCTQTACRRTITSHPERLLVHDTAAAMRTAFNCAKSLFQQVYALGDTLAIIVVTDNERNVHDQEEWIDGPAVRLTLSEIAARCSLDADCHLVYQGRVVAVVYFRAGYNDDEYGDACANLDIHLCSDASLHSDAVAFKAHSSERCDSTHVSSGNEIACNFNVSRCTCGSLQWHARVLVDRSTAVAVPTSGVQLAGSKVAQASYSAPGVAREILRSVGQNLGVSICDGVALEDTFVEQAVMPDARILLKAREHPEDYVYKSIREGGGHVLVGENLRTALDCDTDAVLMRKIDPVTQQHVLFDGESLGSHECVSELGVYSCVIAVDDAVSKVCTLGILSRVKRLGVVEGGVLCGASALGCISVRDTGA